MTVLEKFSELARRLSLRLGGPSGFSSALSEFDTELLRYHLSGGSGAIACAARSRFFDAAFEKLFSDFFSRRDCFESSARSKVCAVAVGGYGRGEVAPKSDVDIMFLFDDSVGDALKSVFADLLMYPLWNAGIRLGHSMVTLSEAVGRAKTDTLSFNSMLDARFVCGSPEVFARFKNVFARLMSARGRAQIDELYRLKCTRHARYGWSAFVQEPNLKNGVGCLRDIQTLKWIALLRCGKASLGALARRGFITSGEYAALLRAEDFEMRVRNEIHFFANRETDVLDMQTQPRAAENLGYGTSENSAEIFMRRLYSAFRTVDGVSRFARKRMGLRLPENVETAIPKLFTPIRRRHKIYADGFTIGNGEINAQRDSVFETDSLRLLRLFSLVQRFRALPSERLELLVRKNLRLIDSEFRANPRAAEIFFGLFAVRGRVAPAVSLMHSTGVLGAFIPEFAEIECFVQREFFHRYTVDEHTMKTLVQADKIFSSKRGDEPYWGYHTALTNVSFPAHLLYLILLLHDIGKGDGIRGHAKAGGETAAKILSRLGLPQSDTQVVVSVVESHLDMARFWQSRDVSDSAEVDAFLSKISGEAHLKFLYAATFCDAVGTSEDFWNSYKQSLHRELYLSALERLRGRESHNSDAAFALKWRYLAELLNGENFSESAAFARARVDALPSAYFFYHGVSDLAMHVSMAGRLFKKRTEIGGNAENGAADAFTNAAPVIKWIEDPDNSIVRLYVVSFDERGLFSLFAGVLALYGMSVLSSKVFTCSDGTTIDTFYLSGVRGVSQNRSLRRRFAEEASAAYADLKSFNKRLCSTFGTVRKLSQSGLEGLPSVKISVGGDADGDLLKIVAVDCDGLLWRISDTVLRCGWNILFARINTENGVASDAFRITPSPSASSSEVLVSSLLKILGGT